MQKTIKNIVGMEENIGDQHFLFSHILYRSWS